MPSLHSRWALTGLAITNFASLTAAVNISFSNCINSHNNQTSSGVPILQFIPYEVHANFNAESDNNDLAITVFGNITGNLDGNNTFISVNDTDYWGNVNNTQGKFTDTGPGTPNFATLFAKYFVATNQIASNLGSGNTGSDFCNTTKHGCPLGPVPDRPYDRNDLPQFNITEPMYGSWGFASINAQFTVNAGDAEHTQILCVSAEATPFIGTAAANLLRYLPVGILLLTFTATASAAWSPWGTFNIYHWSSNHGRDEDQLRLITPGFGDCLAYIQFIVLSGSLALVYPGYFQPATSQVGWSTLMFNQSFYSHGPGINPIVDGLYALNHTGDSIGQYNGLTQMRQLVGMESDNDIWPGLMIWLLVVLAALLVIIQLVHATKMLYRWATRTQDEDLRAKNWPFSVGNVIRVVFNYFLLPLIAFVIYQLALAAENAPGALIGPAVITLIILLVFSGWLLYQILSTHPRAILFDDLPTLLCYGPLYNTYSDAAAPFALVPMLVNLIRGVAIGAIQASGIAQVVVLAIAEVILILSLNAFRPFSSPTSMNLYHTAFSIVRLVVVLLMLAFAHEVNAPYGAKAWVGYVILFLHGLVLFFGFFIHSLQTLLEVVARALGAGSEGTSVQRGSLVKVFGVRQLSRRNPRRSRGRSSMASQAAMLDPQVEHDGRSAGMRSRSMSASSGFILNGRPAGSGRQSLALDTFSQGGTHDAGNSSAGQTRAPGTPSGATSVFSYGQGSSQAPYDPQMRRISGMTAMTGALGNQKPAEPADPYYRPPRARRTTNEALGSPATFGRASANSGDWTNRNSGARGSASDDYELGETGVDSGAPSPAYLGYNRARADSGAEDPDTPKPDYATREVDYYYGVRGPALNDQPTRKLKTGPADPTGPVSSATGWFSKVFGGKTKDKHKGFEVIRGKGVRQGEEPFGPDSAVESPREISEPYRDEPGTPVPEAPTAPRKLDLEDETDAIGAGTRHFAGEAVHGALEGIGVAKSPEDAPVLPDIDAGSFHVPSRFNSQVSRPGHSVRYRDEQVPHIPRQPSGRYLTLGDRTTALATIAAFPSSSDSPAGGKQPADAVAGGLSRMPFGSLGSGTSDNSRPGISQRAGSINSAVSNITDGDNRRPSFRSPLSPIQPPPQLVDTGDSSARMTSGGSIGYVNQHRASEHIVNAPQHAIFGGSQAELVDEGADRAADRSRGSAPHSQDAHINF